VRERGARSERCKGNLPKGRRSWAVLARPRGLKRARAPATVAQHTGLAAATGIPFCSELSAQNSSAGKAPVNNNCTLY